MNIKLLRQIQREIRDEPRRLNMYVPISVSDMEHDKLPPCGTTACIAGFAVLAGAKTRKQVRSKAEDLIESHEGMTPGCVNWYFVSRKAISLLDLTEDQADRLFYVNNWPKRYQRYCEPTDAKVRARIACARISHFIKTKGRI